MERKLTRMKSNSFFRSVALLAVTALAVPLFAKPVSKTINITQSAKVGKADLQAGEYRLLIDGTKATVQKGKSGVAESEGRWEDRDTKSNYDAVLLSEPGQVKEVRFSAAFAFRHHRLALLHRGFGAVDQQAIFTGLQVGLSNFCALRDINGLADRLGKNRHRESGYRQQCNTSKKRIGFHAGQLPFHWNESAEGTTPGAGWS